MSLGLNKPRSKLGKWLDRRGIKQDWLIKTSEVNKQTISSVCNDGGYIPSGNTMQKIIKALREVDPSVKADQFWDL
ncbi:DNA-binding XRE family transcriptional regulator [Paenibacillus sp. DS2015]|uniref:transcriptional regulator n=1 Tax=Paenibacillus sp. DS2015 TaxID=3373917 RepID=UPI003D25824E